jgi:hypothetical protein
MIKSIKTAPQNINDQKPVLENQIKAKGANKNLIILLLALLILSFFIIGYLVLKNKQLKQNNNTASLLPTPAPTKLPAPTLLPSPSPKTSITPNNTNQDWNTYKNKNVAFTFKYPSEATLTQENKIHLSLWGPTQKKDTEFYDGISLSFSLPFKISELSLKEYAEKQFNKSSQNPDSQIISPLKEIVINNKKGYTFKTSGLGEFQYIYLQSENKQWTVEIINASNDPTSQGFQKTVDTILSTFEFTNI